MTKKIAWILGGGIWTMAFILCLVGIGLYLHLRGVPEEQNMVLESTMGIIFLLFLGEVYLVARLWERYKPAERVPERTPGMQFLVNMYERVLSRPGAFTETEIILLRHGSGLAEDHLDSNNIFEKTGLSWDESLDARRAADQKFWAVWRQGGTELAGCQ